MCRLQNSTGESPTSPWASDASGCDAPDEFLEHGGVTASGNGGLTPRDSCTNPTHAWQCRAWGRAPAFCIRCLPRASSEFRAGRHRADERTMRFVGMTASGTTRILLVAIFTTAMLYASACSTACAAGFCPFLIRGSDRHQCDQAPRRPYGSHQGSPEHSNCSGHGHPNVFVGVAGPPLYRPAGAAYHGANKFIARPPRSVVAAREVLWGADLAPPLFAPNLLQQQPFVLRI